MCKVTLVFDSTRLKSIVSILRLIPTGMDNKNDITKNQTDTFLTFKLKKKILNYEFFKNQKKMNLKQLLMYRAKICSQA